MITCPSCKSQTFEGAFFCIDCGEPLIEIANTSTDDHEQDFESVEASPTPEAGEFVVLEPDAPIGLRVMETGDVISLHGRRSFTLGLAIPNQAVVPDVDLKPFGAEKHGVSRIHAELRVEKETIVAIDLNSANGTFVNDIYLEPQEPIRVQNGDRIKLGTLELQLFTRR
jgi:pSer/pThr/pTyr-binding forkhead associated (FHA) protein